MSWYNQSYRHSLARKGIRTSFKAVDVPYYDDVAMSLFSRKDLGRRLGSGRDRIVYAFGKDRDQVIKIALNPTGVKQNKMELEDVGLNPLYYGRDFVVLERAEKTMKDKDDPEEFGLTNEQFYQATRKIRDQYPDSAFGDVDRLSSWGFDKEGHLVLLDKGSLDKFALRMKPSDIDQWNENVAARRIELRNEGRDRLVQLMEDKQRHPEVWREIWNQWDVRPKLRRVKTDPVFLEKEKEELQKALQKLTERRVEEGLLSLDAKERKLSELF